MVYTLNLTLQLFFKGCTHTRSNIFTFQSDKLRVSNTVPLGRFNDLTWNVIKEEKKSIPSVFGHGKSKTHF